MPIGRGIIAIIVAGVAFSAIAQQFGGDSNRQQTTTPVPPTGNPPVATNSSATAQAQAPGPAQQPQQAPAQQQPAQPQVDESALRYFAAQGDTRRVDAEIARLRALYPNWTPPTDLNQTAMQPAPQAPVADPEIDKLWSMFSEERIAEVRAEIAARKASDPQWNPPPDLLTALDIAEARKRLANSSDNQQWRTVLSIATDTPSLLTCQNVDSLWRVAEAFAKTEQVNRAKDVYTYILTNCNNQSERLATLQKALPLLPEQQLLDLLRFERTSGVDQDDFSQIRDELTLRRVDRYSVDDKQSATPEDLATVETMAQRNADPGIPLVLGWYYYHHSEPEKALQWFQMSFERERGPKAAEGVALSLRALNRFVDAENLAYEWRDRTPENMSAYKDILVATLTQDPPIRLDPRVISSAIPVIARDRFYNGAQALGWYSYNTEQFTTARDWFQKALEWNPEDEASAYGLALSLQRLNDTAAFNTVANEWRRRSQRIADLADGIFDRNPDGTPAFSTPQVQDSSMTNPMSRTQAQAVPSQPQNNGYRPAFAGTQPLSSNASVTNTMNAQNTQTAQTTQQRPVYDTRPNYDNRQPSTGMRPGAANTATTVQPQPYAPARPMQPAQPDYSNRGYAPPQQAPVETRQAAPVQAYDERVTYERQARQPAPRAPVQNQAAVAAPMTQPETARRTTPARSSCSTSGNPHTLPAGSALALGWCLMDRNRPLEAVTAFDQAIKRGTAANKQEAAYGKSLAYLRKDLTSEAAIAAAEAPQEPQRQVELQSTILSQRALAAYRNGRYTEALLALSERARIVPEQNDLMIIRGYSYLRLGRYDDALKVFRAVQRTGFNEDAAAGINNVQEILTPSRQF